MALVDSLLTAMVRADGDALVMHVGERPIVVAGPRTIDLSNHGMNLGAMVGMLGQLLSGDALASLKEFGAVEHALPTRGQDHFSVVAARSGEDIWIEIRRRREAPPGQVEPTPFDAEAASPPSQPQAETAEPSAAEEPAAVAADPALRSDEATMVETPTEEATSVPGTVEVATRDRESQQLEPGPQMFEAATVVDQNLDALPESEPPAVAQMEAVDDIPPLDAGQDGEEVRNIDEDQTVEQAATVDEGVDDETQTMDEAQTVEAITSESASALAGDDVYEIGQVESDAWGGQPEALSSPDVPLSDALQADAPESALPAVPADTSPDAMPEFSAPSPPAWAETAAAEASAVEEPESPELVEATKPPEPDALEASDVGPFVPAEAAFAPSYVEAPPLPAMASAGTQGYPMSTIVPTAPMEADRHSTATGSSRAAAPPTAAGETGSVPPDHPPHGGGAPVTRTVRIEVPARAAASRAGIDRLLRTADAAGASELFLVSQVRPYVRVGGNVRPLADETVLTVSDIEALIADVTPEPWRDAVHRGDPAEWLIELSDVGRVRCSTFKDHRGPGANFHFAFLRVVTADDLQLSAETRLLATEPDGLIVIGGSAGSDASGIVAAFVDILNQQRADYIVTLEPQVRVLHVNREALVSQREVGNDPARAAAALRAALREQPDVLVIEGVATPEVAQLTIDAASQERLVIASVEAASAASALTRLLELVPADHRQSTRASMARSFRGAVAQLVLRKTTGGRIAARELLAGTRAVRRAIADGELTQLSDLQSTGQGGTPPLSDSIVSYVRSGVVDVREALRKAPDGERLLGGLKAAGVDVAAVEGWH